MENYLSKLEEIVECKIHLGIMKNPKTLSCHHSFCYECLRKYSKFRNDLICPLCRNIQSPNNIRNLPSAILENKLIDIVNEMRSEDGSNETIINNEIINSNYNNEMNNSEFIVEEIEKTMKNESHYRLVYEKEIREFYQHISEDVYFSNFAVNISDSLLKQIVYVDSHTNQFTLYSATSIQRFTIILNDSTVIPEYIRIIDKNLVLTAKLKTDNQMWSVFLSCDFHGQIINQSQLFYNSNQSGLPSMLGFDFNEIERKYYLCMPENRTISLYDSFLVEIDEYNLNDNSPEFVAFHSSEKQLFVSCPQNKRILIINIENRSFKTISTDHIVPKMIFLTDDEKILFFDSKENRIIWIKIIDEYLFKQQLDIGQINNEKEIKFFMVLPFSTIFISSINEIFTFQLDKNLSTSIFTFCKIL